MGLVAGGLGRILAAEDPPTTAAGELVTVGLTADRFAVLVVIGCVLILGVLVLAVLGFAR